MRNAEGKHGGVLPQINEALFKVGVNGERKATASNFRSFARFQSRGDSFPGVGEFLRIFLFFARGNVAATHLEETKRGYQVGEAVDAENPGDAGSVIYEADDRAGDQHAALHADQSRGVCSRKLTRRDYFLHQSVYSGPIHGES